MGMGSIARAVLVTSLVALLVAACGQASGSPTTSIAPSSPSAANVSHALRASKAIPSTVAPPPDAEPSPSPIGGAVFQAMLTAITEHRPTYRFHLLPDRLEGDWRLDGDADDGFGPGRLFIDVTETRGNLTADPCLDRDFTQGGACVQRFLGNGDRLFLRDVVEANDTRTVVVVLIHPDRSGVTAEVSTVSIRPRPLYTVTELAELVIAVDRSLRALSGG
jgi:hypothetical protein